MFVLCTTRVSVHYFTLLISNWIPLLTYFLYSFSVHNQPAVDHIIESWQFLREAVIAIQESRKLQDNLTLEDLYRYVDNLITQRPPAMLYADLRGNFSEHIYQKCSAESTLSLALLGLFPY